MGGCRTFPGGRGPTLLFRHCEYENIIEMYTFVVCRALGIPARSVTNFASAHDTDQSVTIDYFVDEDSTILDNSDSVW